MTYSNESKVRELSVPRELLESVGAVSAEVAQAMAFYHLNKVRQFVKRYITVDWFDTQHLIKTNHAPNCNAFFDG